MSKRYLTKEEKKNFILWTKENLNGTLLTSESLSDLCKKNDNDAVKIGNAILSMLNKSAPIRDFTDNFLSMDDDVPFLE